MTLNINEARSRYPFVFGSYVITQEIGSGAHGTVFKVERTENGHTLCSALKIISIPQTDSEIAEKRAEGYPENTIGGYYKDIASKIAGEVYLLSKVKGNSYVVAYEDHQIVSHPDGIGWDILIRMEYLSPLKQSFKNKSLNSFEIRKLGMDLCHALASCAKHNIIHRDIKPENIFVSDDSNFKLGDFGVARTCENMQLNLSKKGTYSYMAPEVYRGEHYNASVDIYSLGMVMYRYLNSNKMPFLSGVESPTYNMEVQAVNRRMAGEKLPVPIYTPFSDSQAEISVAGQLIPIVLKACSANPAMRYPTPESMLAELEKIVINENAQPQQYSPSQPQQYPQSMTLSQPGYQVPPNAVEPASEKKKKNKGRKKQAEQEPQWENIPVQSPPLSQYPPSGNIQSQAPLSHPPVQPQPPLQPQPQSILRQASTAAPVVSPSLTNQQFVSQPQPDFRTIPVSAPQISVPVPAAAKDNKRKKAGRQTGNTASHAPLPSSHSSGSATGKKKVQPIAIILAVLCTVLIVCAVVLIIILVGRQSGTESITPEVNNEGYIFGQVQSSDDTANTDADGQNETDADGQETTRRSNTAGRTTTTRRNTDNNPTSPPATSPPRTSPPRTNPPITNPPATNPPATNPPVTSPPVTSPPATQRPLDPPGGAGVGDSGNDDM